MAIGSASSWLSRMVCTFGRGDKGGYDWLGGIARLEDVAGEQADEFAVVANDGKRG
ncbi:MAG: hypothetical protein CM1200mP29_16830 [Verrucomicrobiota bacterium]|nr:MAG: hypothetical protein CM1200mP29_16830 [Verrucomicrobiota bacterium]